jgi:predicted transcriptional regulator
MGFVINLPELELKAGRRGLSLSGLADEAGVTRKTMAKIRRREEVKASIAARLDAALDRIPELEHVS